MFISHSFRRGGTIWAFRALKVPGELITIHVDWASEAFLRYLVFTLEQRLQVVQGMVHVIQLDY